MIKILKSAFCIASFSFVILSCQYNHDCSDYKETEYNYNQEAIELSNHGAQFQMKGEIDSALHYFDLAIQKDSSYYLPHSNKANLLINEGKLDQAKLEFETIVELRPDMAEGHGGLGMFYDYLGLDEAAKAEYESAITIYTNRIECSTDESLIESGRMDRALMYMLNGQSKLGKSEFESLKAEFEGEPEMQQWMDEMMNLEKESFLKEMYE